MNGTIRNISIGARAGDADEDEFDSFEPLATTGKYAYVARLTCGCVVAAAIVDPIAACDYAKNVAAWLGKGLVVDRVPMAWVRSAVWKHDCPHFVRQEEMDL